MEESHGHAEHHHVIDPKVFMRTFAILTVLMAATIGASFISFGDGPIGSYIANGIALTIACIKATLVFLYFMGAKYATRLVQVYAALGFIWVGLMGIVVCDYATRHWEPHSGWEVTEASPSTQLPGPRMQNPYEKHETGGETAGSDAPGAGEH